MSENVHILPRLGIQLLSSAVAVGALATECVGALAKCVGKEVFEGPLLLHALYPPRVLLSALCAAHLVGDVFILESGLDTISSRESTESQPSCTRSLAFEHTV